MSWTMGAPNPTAGCARGRSMRPRVPRVKAKANAAALVTRRRARAATGAIHSQAPRIRAASERRGTWMSEHVALSAPSPITLGEATREIANGITSAFVLLALMLPLGLLAFGHFENLAVE